MLPPSTSLLALFPLTPFGYSKSPALYCKPVVTRFSEIFQRIPDRAIQEVSTLSPMQAASKQVMKKIFATPPSTSHKQIQREEVLLSLK
jgi:hypothetical protein